MEEEKFEIVAILTNEETGEIEQTMHCRLLPYIPTEYQIIDYQKSWKKCHCGRQIWFNDNWCPACGQKMGFPNIEE